MNHESLSRGAGQSDADLLHELNDKLINDDTFQPYPNSEYCGNDDELARPNNEFYKVKEERIQQLRAQIEELEVKIAGKPSPEQ